MKQLTLAMALAVALSFLSTTAEAGGFLGDCKPRRGQSCQALFNKKPTYIKLATSDTCAYANGQYGQAQPKSFQADVPGRCEVTFYTFNGWRFRGQCNDITGDLRWDYTSSDNGVGSLWINGQKVFEYTSLTCWEILIEGYN